jgi:hypothetical protein
MSKIEVDQVDPQSGTTLTLGTSGDTITVPTGVTLDASNATTTLPATVVTTDGSQTLTNKTIDASQLSGTITPSDATVTPAKLNYNYNQNRNIIINGDMSIAQRGTSATGITGTGYNTVDRFENNMSSFGTWTQSQETDAPTGQGFTKSLKMECTTANASLSASDIINIRTKFEGQNLQYLKKGTANAESLTLSFWVKSSTTGTYICEFRDVDNNRSISKSYTINSADTWEKKTITIDGDTSGAFDNDNARSMDLYFYLGAGSNYASGTLNTSWNTRTLTDVAVGQVNLGDTIGNNWYITGVQLEAGTTASDFEFLPHDVNLERCMRYYQKSYEIDDAPGTATSTGTVGSSGNTSTATTTSQIIETVSLLKPMRAEPTITVYDFAGTSGKVTGIDYGVNEYNNQTGAGFRVGSKYFGVQASSLSNASSSLACHYTASAEL